MQTVSRRLVLHQTKVECREMDDHLLSQYLITMSQRIEKNQKLPQRVIDDDSISTSDFGSLEDIIINTKVIYPCLQDQ